MYSIFANQEDVTIVINNSIIKRQFSVKYLGVTIDENLKWEGHINKISLTLSRNIGVMGRVRPYLSPKELVLLYNTLILPHLCYCAVVWGGSYAVRLNKIVKLQKEQCE